MAFAAVWPVAVFCDDAVAVAGIARSGVNGNADSAGGAAERPVVHHQLEGQGAALAGAVNVGLTAVGSDRVTAGPPVWVHW